LHAALKLTADSKKGALKAAEYLGSTRYGQRARATIEAAIGRPLPPFSGGDGGDSFHGGEGGGGIGAQAMGWQQARPEDAWYHRPPAGTLSAGGHRLSPAAARDDSAWSRADRGARTQARTLQLVAGEAGFGMRLADDGVVVGYSVVGRSQKKQSKKGGSRQRRNRRGPAEKAGVPLGARVCGIEGVAVATKDAIVRELRRVGGAQGGAVQFTFVPPSGVGAGGSAPADAGAELGGGARAQHGLAAFLESSDSESESTSSSG
jgi:hypothetical protein